MSRPSPIAGYERMPDELFYKPQPGDTLRAFGTHPYKNVDWASGPDRTAITHWYDANVFVEMEQRIYMTWTAWNHPHVCTHEGPWTLHSCRECDIREAKLVVALIAFLTGQQSALDMLKPRPEMACVCSEATLYAPCPTCRPLIWQLDRAGYKMRDLDAYARVKKLLQYRHDPGVASWPPEPWLRAAAQRTNKRLRDARDAAKRTSCSVALGPYPAR